MRPRHPVTVSAALTLMLCCVSCSKSPTGPSTVAQPGISVSLTLVAPQEVSPGESVQLTANAVKSDGSVENVSSRAQWTAQSLSAGSSVLDVTPTGLATAKDRGRSIVTVRFAGLTADATILVLPKGTFRLSGRISGGGIGLENVTVTVVAGVGEGLTAHTDVEGDYELYGVAGAVQIRATKEGYLERAHQVVVTAHSSLAFELTTDGSRTNYSGVYTLTITAGACSPGFPEEAKRRVYTARVDQMAADLQVTLSGAEFWAGSGAFAGVVVPSGEIRFTIRPVFIWDYDATDLMERLSNGDSLIIGGPVIARNTPTGISGTSDHIPPTGDGAYMRFNIGPGGCNLDRFEMVSKY